MWLRLIFESRILMNNEKIHLDEVKGTHKSGHTWVEITEHLMFEFSTFTLSTIHFAHVINPIRHEKSQSKSCGSLMILKKDGAIRHLISSLTVGPDRECE